MNPDYNKPPHVNVAEVPQAGANMPPPTHPQSPPPHFQTIYPPQPTMQYGAQPSPQPMQYVQQPQMQQGQPMKQEYMVPQQPQGQGQQFRQATPIPSLGMSSAPVDCPSCGSRKMTNITYHAGNTTHVWAGVTFCLTGCLCFIPYLMNSLKDVQHRCGQCGLLLATWHKSGATEAHAHN